MAIQNNLLLRTLRQEKVERPPVWLMRQAGRILPQYRALRGSLSGFKELVQTPDLAAEVTIQPIDELDVDAAIIFSDILVIPEAMGLDYDLIEKKGPRFPEVITSAEDISRLIEGTDASSNLNYVYDAIKATKKGLADRVPLIGFSGAPWTLLAYMVEGQGSKTFSKAKAFLYRENKLAHVLLQKLTNTIIAYLNLKIEAGVDVVQVFDSWAGMLSKELYDEFCMPYLHQICNAITEVPVIVFAKGAWFSYADLGTLDCAAIGLDWQSEVHFVKKSITNTKVLQGNMDPCQLYGTHEEIQSSVKSLIEKFDGNHIVNLGHGVYPDTPLDGVKSFVQAVKTYSYS